MNFPKRSFVMFFLITFTSLLMESKAKVYFSESFDDTWTSRWVESTWKDANEIGSWNHTAGDWYVDASDKGLKTGQDARFYGLSAALSEPLDNQDKDFYLQYLVKHEQTIDCGGAYLKLIPSNLDQSTFGGDSPYALMFGPDICGGTQKTHAILNYQRPTPTDAAEVNMDHRTSIECKSDEHAHLYSIALKQDNTYVIKIDDEIVKEGSLDENWNFRPSATIEDPDQTKPNDWVDEAEIPDPSDTKPNGYDDIPAEIPDPDATEPDDWDEEDDGEWEPPMVNNPAYNGPWAPKMIPNPAYQGEWEHPRIDNPDYFEDDKMYYRCRPCAYVGLELWQVKAGTIFDDMLLTDEVAEAEAHASRVMEKIKALKKEKTRLDDENEQALQKEAALLEEEKSNEEDVKEDEEVATEKDEL